MPVTVPPSGLDRVPRGHRFPGTSASSSSTSSASAGARVGSVHLDVVAVVLLHLLRELLPVDTCLRRQGREALLHARLHALQAAHVDVGLRRLHQLPELLRVLRHPRLDVHPLARGVLLLTRDRVVGAELVGELLRVLVVLVDVEQRVRVRDAEEEPRQALKLAGAVGVGADLVVEEQAHVGAHRRDAGARREHDDVAVLLDRQEHLGSGRARDEHLVALAHVADVVRAHAAVDLGVGEAGAGLVRLVFSDLAVGVLEGPLLLLHLDDTLDAEGDRLGVLAVADRRRADRVEADLGRGLALLVGAGRDDPDGLSLHVRHLAPVVEGHVRRLPVGIARGAAVGLGDGVCLHVVLDHGALVRRLRHEQVPRDLLAVQLLDDLHALLLHRGRAARDHRGAHGDGRRAQPDRGRDAREGARVWRG
mmetsp:Transcript_106989/g.282124  ORF Transcript_106989/g.282124 Transcript_106989/m.282124 type:complete len:421 (-) Transcript_106989:162-1424(-)